MKMASVSAEQIVGVGIDFTACTMLPVTADGTPLCFLDEFRQAKCMDQAVEASCSTG